MNSTGTSQIITSEDSDDDCEEYFLQATPNAYDIKERIRAANDELFDDYDSYNNITREQRVTFRENLVDFEPDFSSDDGYVHSPDALSTSDNENDNDEEYIKYRPFIPDTEIDTENIDCFSAIEHDEQTEENSECHNRESKSEIVGEESNEGHSENSSVTENRLEENKFNNFNVENAIGGRNNEEGNAIVKYVSEKNDTKSIEEFAPSSNKTETKGIRHFKKEDSASDSSEHIDETNLRNVSERDTNNINGNDRDNNKTEENSNNKLKEFGDMTESNNTNSSDDDSESDESEKIGEPRSVFQEEEVSSEHSNDSEINLKTTKDDDILSEENEEEIEEDYIIYKEEIVDEIDGLSTENDVDEDYEVSIIRTTELEIPSLKHDMHSTKYSENGKHKKCNKRNKNNQPINCRIHCLEKKDLDLISSGAKYPKEVSKGPALKLRKRTCCERQEQHKPKLPLYNGLISEYGLSKSQIERKQRRKERNAQRTKEKSIRILEEKKQKDTYNEEIFCAWLKSVTQRKNNQTHRNNSSLIKQRPKTANDVYTSKTYVKGKSKRPSTSPCKGCSYTTVILSPEVTMREMLTVKKMNNY